jgi:transcriptional regulator with XRE-family HTH domain
LPPAHLEDRLVVAEKRSPVDAHVGARLRLRRTLLGMSQEKLGAAVGLTFQQIQKYEKGANRIGASRLHDFSRVLDVPPSFFFDDMPGHLATAPKAAAGSVAVAAAGPDPLVQRETLELVRAYYKIAAPAVRKRLFELVKAVAGPAPDRAGES